MSAGPDIQAIANALDAFYGDAPRPLALHEPDLSGREAEYLQACIEEGWVSTSGRFVGQFAQMLSARLGGAAVTPMATGTAALHVAMILAGVRPGDEVICPALTFVATANAIAYQHATPHFADCEPATLGLDPERLDAHLEAACEMRGAELVNRETGRPIRALVAVHVFGHPCRIRELRAIADKYGLALIEDAAEAIGSAVDGSPAGCLGDFAALSFNGNKLVTAGAGGALVCRNSKDADRAAHLSTTAKQPHAWAYDHDAVGYNYRLSNLSAAVGVAQLERLDEMLAAKRALAAAFADVFGDAPGVAALAPRVGTTSNHWLNGLRLTEPDLERRDALLQAAHNHKLLCRPVWTPMHRLPMFDAAPRMADMHQTERAQAAIINVPSSAHLAAHVAAASAQSAQA